MSALSTASYLDLAQWPIFNQDLTKFRRLINQWIAQFWAEMNLQGHFVPKLLVQLVPWGAVKLISKKK